MIKEARNKGVQDALTVFGVKNANFWSTAKQVTIGDPGRLMREGMKTFRPGGMLSHQNVWWPSTKGLKGWDKVMPWMQRAGTLMVPLQLYHGMTADPSESHLTNALSTAGQILGSTYGTSGLGMVGGLGAGMLGQSLGKGIGHLLTHKPEEQPSPY